MKLIECVPNISEGKNQDIINQIIEPIKNTSGVHLLDVDPGADTNRTVITFIGEPEQVINVAYKLIKKASLLIDMSKKRNRCQNRCLFGPFSLLEKKKIIISNRFLCSIASILKKPCKRHLF